MPQAATSHSAVGRRKTAVGRVVLSEGTGEITVNSLPLEEYFPTTQQQNNVLEPLQTLSLSNKLNLKVFCKGGGVNAQAGAVKLALARAILLFDAEHRPKLKAAGLLTRDSRMKERKKPGRPGARKRFQFSKR